jgi:hypothetical protein
MVHPLAPTGDAIKKAMELATSPETAEYLADRFLKRVTTLGKDLLEKGKPVWESLREWRDNIAFQYSGNGDPWAGKLGVSGFKNLQENLAQKAVQEISSDVKGKVHMDYAISDSSQFIRGYGAENPAEDGVVKNKIEFYDNLFNAWLAGVQIPQTDGSTINLISKNSIIYEGIDDQIRLDAKGNPIPADPEKVKELVKDRQKGYQKFLKDRGIEVTTRQNDYPAPEAKPVRSTAPKLEVEEKVTPSAPH